jgi:hypothetical protein
MISRTRMLSVFFIVATVAAVLFVPRSAGAQQLLGRCDIHSQQQSFFVYDDGWVVQTVNPANRGRGARDPSGQTFMFMPSSSPTQRQYWLHWNRTIVEIFPNGVWQVVGTCFINLPALVQPPIPPTVLDELELDGAGQKPGQVWRVPRSAGTGVLEASEYTQPAEEVDEFLPPLVPTLALAETCRTGAKGNKEAFFDCVAEGAMGKKELAAYKCMRKTSKENEIALCVLRENMGQNERAALADVERCYSKYGNQWNQYPLCMASGRFDPKTELAIRCIQGAHQGGGFDYWGMAACYVGPQLNLNAEAVVALQCAKASGGDPAKFAACTGGILAARELEKCLTDGVGGDGCFGKNNFFTKQFDAVGKAIADAAGTNSVAAKTWKDLTDGPGKNHEAMKLANNLARATGKGAEGAKKISRELSKLAPRVKIKRIKFTL